MISDGDQLNLAVLEACSARYKTITAKVRRAIVRSVVFIFFTKAVNLDGGSASVFYTNSLFLEELTYAGSFFCVTD